MSVLNNYLNLQKGDKTLNLRDKSYCLSFYPMIFRHNRSINSILQFKYIQSLEYMNQNQQKKGGTIPRIEPVKFIERSNGTVKGYAVNTFHGLVKNYNEDRVSIIMNITKPNFKGRWPRCSYFGVFDGHGGNKCSDFLKQNMHRYITQNSHFPHEPIEALKFGFKKAEQEFLNYAESQNPVERSGSCALVLLIIDEICYIANVGDCRAILSANMGRNVYPISKDHKPDSQSERQRIYNAGGKIYQSSIKQKNGVTMLGPYRIQPGKLSVSRSFGDIEAKLPAYGGNPKVLTAKPEITYFEINNEEHDFIMMCSDGVYDKLANEEVSSCFWNERQNHLEESKEKYQFIGSIPSKVIERSMEKLSMDNLTCLIIVFQDNGRLLLPQKKTSRVTQKEIIKRPLSSIDFDNENKNKINNFTTKITIQKNHEQGKSSRSSRHEDIQSNEHQNRQNNRQRSNMQENIDRNKNGKSGKEQNLKQAKQNVERMIKRKSSANLMMGNQKKIESLQHGSNSLSNSISAKMLAGSKVYQKSKLKESEKISLNDMIQKKNVEGFKKENKETLWKQITSNPKTLDIRDKLIRF